MFTLYVHRELNDKREAGIVTEKNIDCVCQELNRFCPTNSQTIIKSCVFLHMRPYIVKN